jgi:hypothetical protein
MVIENGAVEGSVHVTSSGSLTVTHLSVTGNVTLDGGSVLIVNGNKSISTGGCVEIRNSTLSVKVAQTGTTTVLSAACVAGNFEKIEGFSEDPCETVATGSRSYVSTEVQVVFTTQKIDNCPAQEDSSTLYIIIGVVVGIIVIAAVVIGVIFGVPSIKQRVMSKSPKNSAYFQEVSN